MMEASLILVLEKGLSKLEKQILPCKTVLQNKLSEGTKISEADAEWLDNDANLVDATHVISFLKKDPGINLDDLNEGQVAVVEKLREAAGDIPKKVGNKRKQGFGMSLLWFSFPFNAKLNHMLIRQEKDPTSQFSSSGTLSFHSTQKEVGESHSSEKDQSS
jgi:hypothetical protein